MKRLLTCLTVFLFAYFLSVPSCFAMGAAPASQPFYPSRNSYRTSYNVQMPYYSNHHYRGPMHTTVTTVVYHDTMGKPKKINTTPTSQVPIYSYYGPGPMSYNRGGNCISCTVNYY